MECKQFGLGYLSLPSSRIAQDDSWLGCSAIPPIMKLILTLCCQIPFLEPENGEGGGQVRWEEGAVDTWLKKDGQQLDLEEEWCSLASPTRKKPVWVWES